MDFGFCLDAVLVLICFDHLALMRKAWSLIMVGWMALDVMIWYPQNRLIGRLSFVLRRLED